MKKFTLLFAFLLSLVGVTQAQTFVTDLSALSNGKVYTLTGERGTLLTFDGATMLYGTYDGDKKDVPYDANDPYQQFAILKSVVGDYYLYNVGTMKFIMQSGEINPLSVSPGHKLVISQADSPNGNYQWLLKVNNNMINFSQGYNAAGMCANYNVEDEGNRFCITEVDTLDADVQAAAEQWIQPTVSTAEAPKYYAIKNIRCGNYVSAQLSSENRLSLTTTLQPEGFFYFTDASAAAVSTLPEGAKAVYVHNLSTNKVLAGHTQNPWGDTGIVYYIVPAKSINTSNTNGYVLTKSTTDFSEESSWNNFQGADTQVASWDADDVGSVWQFEYQTADDLSVNITSVIDELKTAALAEAEAEGAQPYYACSEENVNVCKTTISSQRATTYDEYVTAKTNIANALSTLRASERINPLQGGEYVKFHCVQDNRYYMMTDAAKATADSEVTGVIGGQTATDARNIWQVIADGNGGFYLYNPLSGKYMQHPSTDATKVPLVASVDEASVYFVTPENDYFLLGVGTGSRDYLHLQSDENLVRWESNATRSRWYIEQPTTEEVAALEALLTPIADLKAAAANEISNKTLEEINAGVEFYTISKDAFDACQAEALALISVATTHAELEVAKVQAQQLFDNLWTATDNRDNHLTAGTKVKFRNKYVSANYMTTDANGATTSSEVTSASIWELVANDEPTGFYLYNNLSGKYLKHAAGNGKQATMVSDKAEATLYSVQPSGTYVLIGETVENDYNEDYLHADDPKNFVTRWLSTHDRSLWMVTSATEDELTQLNTDIQTNITTQLNAAVAAANAVVDPYKALEFYKPQDAIDAYDAAITAATTGVDTYDEVAAALEAIAAAQAAFEAAVAADDVELINAVEEGAQIKLRNRMHSEYWMSAIDGKVGMKSATDASSIWTLEAAADGGFYLFNPLTNKYVKHSDADNTEIELVDGTENASVYYVHPSGLYVTVGRLAEQSKDENSREYLHGVDWSKDGLGQWVVRWNAEADASQWALISATDAEMTQLPVDIEAYVKATITAYKAADLQTVEAYMNLEYFTATAEAKSTYDAAIADIAAPTDYATLATAKESLDAALAEFLVADRSEFNADGIRAKFVNKAQPTFWLTTNANGVTAAAYEGLESHWKFEANEDNTGFYMYNEFVGKYIKHATGNGVQATLVDKAEASVYNVVPNGLYVSLVVTADEELAENCLHYGTEGYVTRWSSNLDASMWNFEVVSDEAFLTLAADTLAKYKETALLRVENAANSAYYAPTTTAQATAAATINGVSTEVASFEAFQTNWTAIQNALSTMYADGVENGRKPQGGDLIRLRNKVYTTHYLGINHGGLSHYEVVTGEEETAFNSAESTVWELVESEEYTDRFYLKNVVSQSYAEHAYYLDWRVVLEQNQQSAHPEFVELVEGVTTADGELCFVVYTSEGTDQEEGDALFAATNSEGEGTVVNGKRNADASMWAITMATEEDQDNMTAYQAECYHEFVFKPTIERAKLYYCITSEEVDGETVETTVDYIEPDKAGSYSYIGGCVDADGNAIEVGDYETFEKAYWYYLNYAIQMDEASQEEGGTHNPDAASNLVQILNTYMNALVLNKPNRDGFFRIRCVHNDMYVQSEYHDNTKLKLTGDTGFGSIFYFDAYEAADGEGSLLSYKEGYYFSQGKGTQGQSGIYALLKPIGEMGDAFRFDIPANKEFGSYNISSDNSVNQTGRRYLFGAAGSAEDGYRLDNGDDATEVNVDTDLGGNTGYNWVLERVSELPVNINSYGYATFYAPIALKVPESVHAYVAGELNEAGNELSMNEVAEIAGVGRVIPAGTAVVLQTEDEAIMGTTIYLVDCAEEDVSAAVAPSSTGLSLRGSAPKVKRGENTSPELNQVENGKIYTFQMVNDVIGFHPYTGTIFNHFRAFLELPNDVEASSLKMKFNDGVTSIENVFSDEITPKAVFDLSGRRVLNPSKGVYIVNGKKVYLK